MTLPIPDLLTPRLRLHELDPDSAADQAFILELLTQRSFIDNIGDRGVRSLPDAHQYIQDGPVASYRRHGIGLLRLSRREDGAALGVCGLLQRDYLPDPDLGYALLDRHAGQGFASEAAAAVLARAWRNSSISRIAAITAPDNGASIRLLTALGFRFVRMIQAPAQQQSSRLFLRDRPMRED